MVAPGASGVCSSATAPPTSFRTPIICGTAWSIAKGLRQGTALEHLRILLGDGLVTSDGMGPRTCIGNHLAMLEIQLVIAMIMRRYEIEAAPGTTGDPTWRATLHPKGGLRMIRRRRTTS